MTTEEALAFKGILESKPEREAYYYGSRIESVYEDSSGRPIMRIEEEGSIGLAIVDLSEIVLHLPVVVPMPLNTMLQLVKS